MVKIISKETEEKIIEKLSTTRNSLTKISKETGLSYNVFSKIMNKSIQKYISLENEGLSEEELAQRKDILHPKYRRLAGGIFQEQVDVAIEKLSTTYDNLTKISKEVGLCHTPVSSIMNRAIQKYHSLKEKGLSEEELAQRKDILHPKYRRLAQGIVQEQVDTAIEKLSTTRDNLKKIRKDAGLRSITAVENIMNKSIEKGELDPKYRRLAQGIVQEQVDTAIEKLSTTHDSSKKIGGDRNVKLSINSVRRIMNRAIQKYHSLKEKGLSEEELAQRKDVLHPKYKRLPNSTLVQEQVGVAIEKLLTTRGNLTKIGEEVGLHGLTVRNIMNRAIQKYHSLKEKGLSEEELAQRKDVLHPRYKRPFKKFEFPSDFTDYIKTDERLREAVSAVLSSFGEDSGESKEYVFNSIVSKMIPGSVRFSIESLAPYLGDITVGKSNLPKEEHLRKIPKEFLDHDPRLEHEFYKLLEKQTIRSFYDNPERTISEIKQKAGSEQNEFVKGLWYKLHDNLSGILSFDLIRNANPKIPNPEYKGENNYGKV